jgi:hypothetical protein
VLVVAVLRSRERRLALKHAAIGIAAAAIPLFLVLALLGIADDFVRGTFIETLGAGSAYTLNFFTPPASMKNAAAFPDALALLLDRDAFPYLFWGIAVVFVGVAITRRASRRLEPLLLIGVFVVATAISYAERHHLYFGMLAAVLIVALILHLLRRRQLLLATLVILAAIVLAGPTTHMGVKGWMRRIRGPVEPGMTELANIPRARGAYLLAHDAKAVTSIHDYFARTLQPDETFFDFTNSGLLYFLFDRDCPIREYEVAFYQSKAAQLEVIRRLESNPKVRAALVTATPTSRFAVDGIPNAERAPLVWEYLQQNFHPDFAEGDVVIWRRN